MNIIIFFRNGNTKTHTHSYVYTQYEYDCMNLVGYYEFDMK